MQTLNQYDLLQLKTIPARELLEFTYEELDEYISQAKRMRDEASQLADWLTGIRLEKSVRETADENEGGSQ